MANPSIASLTPAPASADEAESWVRGELIRSLMRSSRSSYIVSVALIPAMVGLSWVEVPRWELLAVEIKNRFLASAAHDIRQPVHALGLYADWLGNEPELVHELAPKIVESTKAVNSLFDSLFDLARLDSGKIRLNIETLRLDKLLHDLELQYRPLAEAKGLQFRVHAVPGTVVSDPILLQRMVGNLISNAVKYTQRGGVLVAARRRRGMRASRSGTPAWASRRSTSARSSASSTRCPDHAGTDDGFGLGLYIVARSDAHPGAPAAAARRARARHGVPGAAAAHRRWRRPRAPRGVVGRAHQARPSPRSAAGRAPRSAEGAEPRPSLSPSRPCVRA
jgi:hypothetical protein